jgi:hypothetical protein
MSSVPSLYEDLEDAMESVMVLHNRGCKELKKHRSLDCETIDEGELAAVVIDVATEMASYNLLHHVHPTKLDLTKVLTFTAAALAKQDQTYDAVPLFYSYLDFLDTEVYNGLGMTLRDFGEAIYFAENLNTMLGKGQWLAPWCFFRAIDLTFEKCTIPRVERLQLEVAGIAMK